MSPEVQRLVAKAVVRYLNGNMEQFRAWSYAAHLEYQKEIERNRLHATIEEIMDSKGVSICRKLQAIGQ